MITVSDRSSRGEREDRSGPEAVRLLRGGGYPTELTAVVPDEVAPIVRAVREAAVHADVVLTTGGTGLGPRDVTPQAMDSLDGFTEVPGLAEAIRSRGVAGGLPAAVLTRGRAGIVRSAGRRVLVVNAPGSPGGVRDAVAVLGPVLTHLVDQLAGRDH